MTVKISNLPSSIAKDKIHFAYISIDAYVSVGPIILPRPGPTFANALAEAENAVIKSSPNRLKIIPIRTKDNINIIKNDVTALLILSGISFPLYNGINIAFGNATFFV